MLVSALTRQLTQRGVAIDERFDRDACPAVRATVVRDGGSVAVTLVEPTGARHRRRVTTTDIAATWIESRMASDVASPLLAARVSQPTLAPAREPGSDAVAVTAGARPRDPVTVAAMIESGAASDQSSWRSYAVSACAPLGPLCVGALGRFGTNDDYTDNQGLTFADRTTADVYATASYPRRVGQFTLQPELGVGLGWMRTRQSGLEPYPPLGVPNECAFDGIDPAFCTEPAAFEVSSRGARLMAGVRASVPLGERVSLDLGVSAELRPGAHTDLFVRAFPYPQTDPCTDPVSPGCAPDGMVPSPVMDEEDPFLRYPGEPRSVLRAGIGVRVGLP